MGPWHHVGTTMEITLDKNWIHTWIRRELNPLHAKPEKRMNLGSPPWSNPQNNGEE